MMRLRTTPLPLSLPLLALLAAAYILPGLIGHDPWKSEDAIGIGLVHQFLNGGDWIPRLAGEPYFEDGPLYYWLAALLAKLLGWALPLHDAARLMSGIALAAALMFVRLAGKTLHGVTQGNAALLALLGALGLLVHAHETSGEIGALAGIAVAYYGIALARSRPRAAACALAGGIVVAALCKGPLSAFAPAVTALALPLISREWRGRTFGALAFGLLAGLALAACWPLALYLKSPQLFGAWQAAIFPRPDNDVLLYPLQTIAWAAWPVWPLALWELWRRRSTLTAPETLPPLLGMLAVLIQLFLIAPEARDIQVLPLLPPLALLAGSAVDTLRRGAANAFAWFGAMTFTLFGALVWLGWFAMMTGTPPTIARNFAKLEPGFVPHFEWLPFVVALAFCAAWIWLILRAAQRSLTYWASGVTLLWCLVMMLWLPWIDYGKSYRGVAQSLAKGLSQQRIYLAQAAPRAKQCIESRGIGEAQRAVFHYHAGIVTRRAEVMPSPGCPLLLIQAKTPGPADDPGPGWKRVWEGNRPRDSERYRLYMKKNN